jgi:outer membrane protein assembly factor BamB
MDGKLVWKTELNGTFCESSPTFQDGFMYVATGTVKESISTCGHMIKITAENGTKVWTAKLPNAPAGSSPAKIGDRVFVCCSNLAIGARTGR